MPSWSELNATPIAPLVAYTHGEADGLTLWHWCVAAADGEGWLPSPVPADGVTSLDPLDLTDLVVWPCCGLRGHIHNGRWTP